jgi:hypothetical protein
MCWRLLEELGCDPAVVNLMRSLYANLTVYFAASGQILKEESKRHNGLLQGCPMSVLCLIALMTCWAKETKAENDIGPRCDSLQSLPPDHVQRRFCQLQVGIKVYIDDRMIWSDSSVDLARALQRTWHFDHTVQMQWNMRKGQLFALIPEDELSVSLAPWIAAVGSFNPVVESLGITINIRADDLLESKDGARDTAAKKAEVRLSRIPSASNTPTQRPTVSPLPSTSAGTIRP